MYLILIYISRCTLYNVHCTLYSVQHISIVKYILCLKSILYTFSHNFLCKPVLFSRSTVSKMGVL